MRHRHLTLLIRGWMKNEEPSPLQQTSLNKYYSEKTVPCGVHRVQACSYPCAWEREVRSCDVEEFQVPEFCLDINNTDTHVSKILPASCKASVLLIFPHTGENKYLHQIHLPLKTEVIWLFFLWPSKVPD